MGETERTPGTHLPPTAAPEPVDRTAAEKWIGQAVLRMHGISKRFPGVVALDDVSLELRRGEVLALVGENGAGKSTLMKVLSGACRPDAGSIELFGELVRHASPLSMMRMGLAIIYQELLLAGHLSVAENIFLGRQPRTRMGAIDWKKMRAGASELIKGLGFEIDVHARLDTLSVAHRQIVEIAKALSQKASVIVLDEPSAVLGDAELDRLMHIIRRLCGQGVSFIYISHRLEEVFEISHRVAVMRDGRMVGVEPTEALDKDTLVRMMVGRDISSIYPERRTRVGPALLRIQGLTSAILNGISITVRRGEIVGVCGLAGSGRSELLRAICGADAAAAETFELEDRAAAWRSPKQALRAGVGMVPEDRRHQGLFVNQSVAFNIAQANLSAVSTYGILSRTAEARTVSRLVDRLRIKTPGIGETVANLSGGNQQKCVLGKLLNARCRLLLVDEPTRGVDIGAKREIYQVLADLADQEGIAILMVSSELPEVIGLCDRAYVMREGRVTGEFSRAEMTEERIMHAATA